MTAVDSRPPDRPAIAPDAPASVLPRRRLDKVVAVLFVVILVVPGIALAAGVRSENLEARQLARLPRVDAGAPLDAAFYAALDRVFVDHFPFRTSAVELHALLDYGLLGASTTPDVIVGAGDWLFFRGEIRPTCSLDAVGFLAMVDALAASATAGGRSFRLAIAPDKHAINPERLGPAAHLGPPCTDGLRAAVRAGFAARPETTVDLWTPLEAAHRADPAAELHWHQDSHWTPAGSILAIQALIEAEAPGVWNRADVAVRGTLDRATELSRLIGLPKTEPVPDVVVRRDQKLERTVVTTAGGSGEASDATDNGRQIIRYRATGAAPTAPGTTLFVYDSFFGLYIPEIAPWFADSIWVHVSDLSGDPTLVDRLPAYDHVVWEVVEREAYHKAYANLLAPLVR